MRIVVKVGSSSLTHETGLVNLRQVEKLVKVLADIQNAGHEVILVSSGAVAVGRGKLKMHHKPDSIVEKQAVAAVGQCELMYMYDRLFTSYSNTVAQILLTADDVEEETRMGNFKNTITKLLSMHVIPIINENDTLATEEFGVGDNDTLSALVAKNIDADILVLLSDIDGLYTANPQENPDAKLISEVAEVTKEIEDLAGGPGSNRGTGGMITKIRAAKLVMAHHCDMIITNGKSPEVLYDIIDGKSVGTRFLAK